MPVFLPSTVILVDGSFFAESVVITRRSTGRRQNIGIWTPLSLFRRQVALPCILEVRLAVTLRCRPLRANSSAANVVLVQQGGDALLGDGAATRPLRPRLLRIRRQALDDGLGCQVVEGRRLEHGFDVLQQR